MYCPVCSNPLNLLFSGKILDKYKVSYFKCIDCGLIRTESPYWIEEAYSEAIADLDVGIVSRNKRLASQAIHIIEKYYDGNGVFLDYAGGYGLFVRMMRDEGYNFYRQDRFCQNVFAKYFDFENAAIKSKFELVTAFEFIEHVADPLDEIRNLLALSDSIFLTTELQPEYISKVEDWWYFTPETGQHITFYTKKTFERIAAILDVYYFTNGKSLHLLTKNEINNFCFLSKKNFQSFVKNKISTILFLLKLKIPEKRRNSLIWSDYEFIKGCMHKNSKK